jgi:hypothetical protein
MDEPFATTAKTSGAPEAIGRAVSGLNPSKIRDRIPGFHTDFTQNDRLGPRTLRHPGQPTNPQMPMKSKKAVFSAGLPADPPSCCSNEATRSESTNCEPPGKTGTGFPDSFSDKLTPKPVSMNRKRKRRSSIVEIGNGPTRVKIYSMNRRDGYPEFTLAWKEAGKRKTRSFASMEEARMIAQQTSVRLTNGWTAGEEVTRRDIDLLRHCEQVAQEHGVGLAAAIDEWASARRAAGEIPLADAVRFYRANRKDLLIPRTLAQVAEEFIESRRANGSSEIHVRNCKDYLGRLTGQMKANIADVTTAELNKFIRSQTALGPVSRNSLRGTIVSMFRFAKRQNYLHPDRDTVADMTESCKVPETEITIFTPEEMTKMLLASHAHQILGAQPLTTHHLVPSSDLD